MFVSNYATSCIFLLFTFCIKNICFWVASWKNKNECLFFNFMDLNSVILRRVYRIRCFCSLRSKLTREKGDFLWKQTKNDLTCKQFTRKWAYLIAWYVLRRHGVSPSRRTRRLEHQISRERASLSWQPRIRHNTLHFASSLGHYHFSNDAL